MPAAGRTPVMPWVTAAFAATSLASVGLQQAGIAGGHVEGGDIVGGDEEHAGAGGIVQAQVETGIGHSTPPGTSKRRKLS